MSKLFWQVCKVAPAVLGASLLVNNSAFAAENFVAEASTNTSQELADASLSTEEMMQQINDYNGAETSLDQVTSVNQLTDIDPFWYGAVEKMVDKYGCIVGYPDGTFKGQRNITRYEFAAAVSRCMEWVEANIGSVEGDDLITLRRLVEEFEVELAALGARVDDLEGRVAFVEDNQFSTTTKLKGEVIFSLDSAFGADNQAVNTGNAQGSNGELQDNITFSDRVRLTLDTSFTGKDRLRTRLQAGNMAAFDDRTGTDMARLGYEANNNGGGNNVGINRLYYKTPLGKKLSVIIGADISENDMLDETNPLFASSGGGAISRFNRRNPAVHRFPVAQGLGFTYKFSDSANLQLAYAARRGEDPSQGRGLFNGSYTALAQFNLSLLEDKLGLSATYGRGYYSSTDVNLSGSVGSSGNSTAQRPFGRVPTSANRFGVQGDFALTDAISVGGWVGYVDAEQEITGDDADVWNWTARLGFKDVGGEGNVLGIMFGMPPKLTSVDNGVADSGTSYLLEALYKYKVSKNIAITPGLMVLFNPEHNDANETIYVGVLRTTFKF